MVIAGSLNWLAFDPVKDEVHFWATSLEFAQQPLPSFDLLRSYGELNTPLPFSPSAGSKWRMKIQDERPSPPSTAWLR